MDPWRGIDDGEAEEKKEKKRRKKDGVDEPRKTRNVNSSYCHLEEGGWQ
jgi:hypothetical protein